LEGPCTARPEDLPSLVALTNQVFRPQPRPGDMGREFPVLLSAANAGNLHVFRDAGRVVSHVGVLRQRICTLGVEIPVACIGAVCTDPKYRKGGLAGQLMDRAIKAARDNCDVLMPISGKRTLYVSRGATSLGPQVRLKVPLSQAEAPDSRFHVRTYSPGDWSQLAGLQQTEPIRYQWGEREPCLLEAIRGFGGICLLASDRADGLSAALVFCVGHPMYGGEDGSGRVIQFLGDPQAIPALLASAASHYRLTSLDWYVLTTAQPAVAQRLLAAGATGKASITGWTIVILDLPRLIEKVGPVAARAGVELAVKDGRLIVAAEGKSVSLAQPDQQVEILFRHAGTWSAELACLPVELRTACSVGLPIPLPDYGVNYV